MEKAVRESAMEIVNLKSKLSEMSQGLDVGLQHVNKRLQRIEKDKVQHLPVGNDKDPKLKILVEKMAEKRKQVEQAELERDLVTYPKSQVKRVNVPVGMESWEVRCRTKFIFLNAF